MNFITNALTDKVKNYAIKNWRCYSFKQEWLSIIILVLTVKVATSAVSVFSGYYYLTDVFRGLFGSETLQKTFAVISLVLIELLNALFLAKAFKFILRLNNFKWIFPLILSVGLFFISFVTSTNGIAIYTADKVDLTANIEEKYKTMVDAVKAETAANIDICKQQIENIKQNPSDWKDGKRCILSAGQLAEINKAYDKISALNKDKDLKISQLTIDKNTELSDNQAVTINTSEKYYTYVSVIMAIQIICSFLLWYFWAKISGEDDTENEQKENIEQSLNRVLNTVDGCIYNRIDTRLNALNTIYNGIAAETRQTTTATTTHPKNMPKIVGFNRKNTTTTATPETHEKTEFNEGNTVTVSQVHGTPENALNSVKTCLCCGNALNDSQIIRHAKYCSPKCRITYYNITHPERKPLSITNAELS